MFSHLADWFQRMSEVDEVEESDETLYDIIEKYELDWKVYAISE